MDPHAILVEGVMPTPEEAHRVAMHFVDIHRTENDAPEGLTLYAYRNMITCMHRVLKEGEFEIMFEFDTPEIKVAARKYFEDSGWLVLDPGGKTDPGMVVIWWGLKSRCLERPPQKMAYGPGGKLYTEEPQIPFEEQWARYRSRKRRRVVRYRVKSSPPVES